MCSFVFCSICSSVASSNKIAKSLTLQRQLNAGVLIFVALTIVVMNNNNNSMLELHFFFLNFLPDLEVRNKRNKQSSTHTHTHNMWKTNSFSCFRIVNGRMIAGALPHLLNSLKVQLVKLQIGMFLIF